MSNREKPVLLTPSEAAALLNIGRTRLFDLLRTGALRSIVIGERKRLVPRSEIDAFVLRQMSQDNLGSDRDRSGAEVPCL